MRRAERTHRGIAELHEILDAADRMGCKEGIGYAGYRAGISSFDRFAIRADESEGGEVCLEG